MSDTRSHNVAAALSRNHETALGCRDDWWHESRAKEDHEPSRTDRPDPNDPATIIAHQILRETGTMLCATTLLEQPWNGGRMAELFAWCFDDELIDGRGYMLHYENKAIELTEPTLRSVVYRVRISHVIETESLGA